MATQAATVIDEVLGSSDGSKHQRFRTSQRPVLGGERLEVRERGAPAAVGAPAEPRSDYGWVAWTAVDVSTPRARATATSCSTANVARCASATACAARSRRSARATRACPGIALAVAAAATRRWMPLTGLQTPIASIDRVFNGDSASGGADAEAFDDSSRARRERFAIKASR